MTINGDFLSAQATIPSGSTPPRIPLISDKVWDAVLAQIQSGPAGVLPLVLVEPDAPNTDIVTLAALQAIAHGRKPNE